MSLKIALCDDSAADCRYMHDLVSNWAQENSHPVSTVQFTSAESFLFAWEEDKTFDILLLDIEMGETNGVELARNLRRKGADLQKAISITFEEAAFGCKKELEISKYVK